MADDRKDPEEGFTLGDIDFGENDEELESALKVSKTTAHSLDISDLLESFEGETGGEEDPAGGTVVLNAPERDEDGPSDQPGRDGSATDPNQAAPSEAEGDDDEDSPTVVAQADIDLPTMVVPAKKAKPQVAGAEAAAEAEVEAEAAPEPTGNEPGIAGAPAAAAERDAAFDAPEAEPARKLGRGPIVAIVAVVAIAVVVAFFSIGGAGGAGGAGGTGGSSPQPVESSAEATYEFSIAYVDLLTSDNVKEASEQALTEAEIPATVEPPAVKGYEVVGGTDNDKPFYTRADYDAGEPCTLELSDYRPMDHDVTFTYAKHVSYTVRFLEAGTDAEVAAPKVTSDLLAGDQITEQPREIEGYNFAADALAPATITLGNVDGDNVITFHYEKKPVASAPAASASSNQTYTQPSYSPSTPTYSPSTPSAPARTDDSLDGTWGK